MCKVADANRILLFDIGEERALVVNQEVEDSVLVGKRKGHAVDGGVIGGARKLQVQAVEGREHGELELEKVVFGEDKGHPLVPDVLGQGDSV